MKLNYNRQYSSSHNMSNKFSNQNIGLLLRNARIEKGKTLHQVGSTINIDSTLLSKIELGRRLPTEEQARKISDYYNLPFVDFLAMIKAKKIVSIFGNNITTIKALKLVEKNSLKENQ